MSQGELREAYLAVKDEKKETSKLGRGTISRI